MADRWMGGVGDGHLGNWGFPEGGMGAVADAIAAAARSFGVEIRLNSKVSQVLVENGRAVGIALDNGDELTAGTILPTLPPRPACLDLVRETDPPRHTVTGIQTATTRNGGWKN